MLAFLPALLQIVPALANLVLGGGAKDTVNKVANIAGQVLGADPSDPQAMKTAILGASPDKQVELREKLMQLAHDETMAREQAAADQAKADHDEIMARIADVEGARNQTVTLAQAHSPLAWGAPIISVLVLGTFGLVLWMVLSKSIPPGQENLVYLMLGTLSTMASAVVGYWVGSSAGSAQKADLLSKVAAGAVKK